MRTVAHERAGLAGGITSVHGGRQQVERQVAVLTHSHSNMGGSGEAAAVQTLEILRLIRCHGCVGGRVRTGCRLLREDEVLKVPVFDLEAVRWFVSSDMTAGSSEYNPTIGHCVVDGDREHSPDTPRDHQALS